jgi:hypothetical protein
MNTLRSLLIPFLGIVAIPACAVDATPKEETGRASEAFTAEEFAVHFDQSSLVLGMGLHRASLGELTVSATGQPSYAFAPAGSRIRWCQDEANGAGANCTEDTYDGALLPFVTVPGPIGTFIKLIEVTPLAFVFQSKNFQGDSQSLGFGEHRASDGAFTSVPNDQARSVRVPPGLTVRLCSDEGGTAGHGTGHCQTFDNSAADITGLGGISYAEVLPAVTVFREAGWKGIAQTLTPGKWLAMQQGLSVVGNDLMQSIAFPTRLGILVNVCNDDVANGTGFGDCRTFTHAQTQLTPANISFVNVIAVGASTTAVSVAINAAGTSTGSVTSTPFGFVCTTGTCSATFARRRKVILTAAPAAGAGVTFTGCDAVIGNRCEVTPDAARSVTARFDLIPDSPSETCMRQCFADCAELPPALRGQCHEGCVQDCSDLN